MLLAIDIGNSSVSVGVFDLTAASTPTILCNFKISSKDLSSDEYKILMDDFLRRSLPTDAQIDGAVISSVVPTLTEPISLAAQKICGKPPFLIGSGIKTGFGIKIKNPEQLGADIVSNVAAALQTADAPLIVLDMGTATTITVVDECKNILGTIIIPGLKISLHALYDSAAQLSDIVMDNDPEWIGRDTKASICSGVIHGNALMIDGFIRNIREQLGLKNSEQKLNLVATGGLCERILPHLRNKFLYDEFLTLRGQALLYALHKNKG